MPYAPIDSRALQLKKQKPGVCAVCLREEIPIPSTLSETLTYAFYRRKSRMRCCICATRERGVYMGTCVYTQNHFGRKGCDTERKRVM